MTKNEIVAHWRKGARDSLDVAKLCLEAQKYEQALFHCHLAVEKALKAAFIEQHGEDHPYSHDLAYLAGLIKHSLRDEDMETIKQLTAFVVDARYSDPYWAAEQATEDNARNWIGITEKLLSSLLP